MTFESAKEAFESAKEEARIIRRLLEYIESNIGGEIFCANGVRFKLKCGCNYYVSISNDNIECRISEGNDKCINVIRHTINISNINYNATETLADPDCFNRIKQAIENFDKDYESGWNVLLDIQKKSLQECPSNKLPPGHPDLEYGG